MLKFLFGFLVIANCVLYAAGTGRPDTGGADGREPGRATNQLNAGQIRLVAPDAGSGAIQPATAEGIVTPVAGIVPAPVQAIAPAAAALACIEVGNFDTADARRFDLQLAPLGLGDRLSRRSVQEIERYIVYIPPLADKESADRKANELRQLGIDDFYVLADNSDLRLGISLGVFKTAEAAGQHLANLARKGVRTAKIAARPAPVARTAFQLRGLDAEGEAALAKIRAGFPRQESRACAPA